MKTNININEIRKTRGLPPMDEDKIKFAEDLRASEIKRRYFIDGLFDELRGIVTEDAEFEIVEAESKTHRHRRDFLKYLGFTQEGIKRLNVEKEGDNRHKTA